MYQFYYYSITRRKRPALNFIKRKHKRLRWVKKLWVSVFVTTNFFNFLQALPVN